MRTAGIMTMVILIGVAGSTWGQGTTPKTYEIQKEIALYGNLQQDQVPPGNLGNVACGPVAAVNSFVYLENKYPEVYGRKLIPDDNIANGLHDMAELISAAQILSGPNYDNTLPPGGTYHDNFIWGKYNYIEDRIPGVTRYEAQDQWAWGNPPAPAQRPNWVQPMAPTWQFLFGELVACEDVEILISWSGGGHFVTLSSLHWNDIDGDGMIDFNENAMIDFIDPGTGAVNNTSIWQSYLGGSIETSYFATEASWISMAVSESPIPEPATMTLLALGLGAMLLRRRMR